MIDLQRQLKSFLYDRVARGFSRERRGGRTLRGLAVSVLLIPSLCSSKSQAHPGLHHDIARLTTEISAAPQDASLYLQRAHYRRLDGEFVDALSDLAAAQRLNQDDPQIDLERGLTLSTMNKNAGALAALTKYIKKTGTSGGSAGYAARAVVLAKLGDATRAITDYSAAVSISPNVELFAARGKLQEQMLMWDAAARGYREGFAALGDAVVLRLALIRVETQRGKHNAALQLIDQVLPSISVKTEWLVRRAEVLLAAGRKQESQAELHVALIEANRVLGKRPSAIHLVNRAKVFMAMGNDGAARKDLTLAIEKSARFAQARELLAQIDKAKTGTKGSLP